MAGLDRRFRCSARVYPGQAGRRSHDDKRHGTPSPFAALDPETDPAIGSATAVIPDHEIVSRGIKTTPAVLFAC